MDSEREQIVATARNAVTTLRDFSRTYGMDFRQRDPLVMAIHRALDLVTPSPAEAQIDRMIEQFCCDLNAAHNEILHLQGVAPADYGRYDWPEWSAPANSIRWAERRLGKPLSKTSQRTAPAAAPQESERCVFTMRTVPDVGVKMVRQWASSCGQTWTPVEAVFDPRRRSHSPSCDRPLTVATPQEDQ